MNLFSPSPLGVEGWDEGIIFKIPSPFVIDAVSGESWAVEEKYFG